MINQVRDRNLLYPRFAADLMLLDQRLREAGLHFYLFMGLRTFAEQDELYAQGRTSIGRVVTNARGGQSWHNYGLAADYVLDGMTEKPGIQWSWDIKMDANADGYNDWQQLGEIAEGLNLKWSGRWKLFPELPHVEYDSGLTITEAHEIYRLYGTLNYLGFIPAPDAVCEFEKIHPEMAGKGH